MQEKELIIKDMAFVIHADMKFGIKPTSNAASVRWLNLALAWAIRHKRKELEKIIQEYLDDENETETKPVFALAMNAI